MFDTRALEEVLPEALAILHGEPPRAILGSLAQVNVARRLGAAGVVATEVFATLKEFRGEHVDANERLTTCEQPSLCAEAPGALIFPRLRDCRRYDSKMSR